MKIIENKNSFFTFDSNNLKLYEYKKTSSLDEKLRNIVSVETKRFTDKKIDNPKNYNDVGIFLMVAQDCNMRCSYCYGKGGTYNKSKKFLDEAMAKSIIDSIVNKFELKYIQFFGGEPTLNKSVIIFIVEYVSKLFNDGQLKQMPLFSMVTNLYDIEDDFIKYIKDTNIALTVSIDGEARFHDKLRRNFQDKGTYERIVKNYKRLIDFGVIPNIEITYTGIHENEISLKQIYDFFTENFVYTSMFIASVVGCEGTDLEIKDLKKFNSQKIEVMQYIMDTMCTENPIFSNEIINNIKKLMTEYDKSFYLCRNAPGVRQFTIDCEGDIFPCYCLSGNISTKIGNILSISKEELRENQIKFEQLNKNESICVECSIKGLCSVCLASDYYQMNTKRFGDINSYACELRREYYEALLLKYAEIMSNKDIKDFFIKNMIKGLNR